MNPIVEKDITATLKIKNITVSVVNLELGKQCNLIVGLFDENKQLLKQDLLLLKDEAYTNWSNDDNYIFEYVLQYYGFTKDESNNILNENNGDENIVV